MGMQARLPQSTASMIAFHAGYPQMTDAGRWTMSGGRETGDGARGTGNCSSSRSPVSGRQSSAVRRHAGTRQDRPCRPAPSPHQFAQPLARAENVRSSADRPVFAWHKVIPGSPRFTPGVEMSAGQSSTLSGRNTHPGRELRTVGARRPAGLGRCFIRENETPSPAGRLDLATDNGR